MINNNIRVNGNIAHRLRCEDCCPGPLTGSLIFPSYQGNNITSNIRGIFLFFTQRHYNSNPSNVPFHYDQDGLNFLLDRTIPSNSEDCIFHPDLLITSQSNYSNHSPDICCNFSFCCWLEDYIEAGTQAEWNPPSHLFFCDADLASFTIDVNNIKLGLFNYENRVLQKCNMLHSEKRCSSCNTFSHPIVLEEANCVTI